MQWISVNDRLPVIPKDKYGIGILVVQFDHVYEEMSPGNGQTVTANMYSYLTDRKDRPINDNFADAKVGDKDFITLTYGPSGVEWFPCVDDITHWMYMPLPPER